MSIFKAFSDCTNLRKAILGSGITHINGGEFDFCTSLDSIICYSTEAPALIDEPFGGVKRNGMIVCPEESDYFSWIEVYKQGSLPYYGWRLSNQKRPAPYEIWYKTIDGSKVTPIITEWNQYNQYLYKMYPSLINNSYFNGWGVIRFDMAIPHIPNGCFKNCNVLTDIVLPDSTDFIYTYAFQGCNNLKTVSCSETLRGYYDYCFANCSSLDSLYIPSNVNNISSKAFVNVPNLQKIVVSDDNSTFDSRDNCNAIIRTATNTLIVGSSETIIPLSVKSIDSYAFYGNSRLVNILIADAVESIGAEAFCGCTELKSVEFSNSLKTISDYAFCNCVKLQSVELPNTLTQMGKGIFNGCSELVYFDIPEQIHFFPTIRSCPKLKHITMGKNINYIYNGDIYNCDSLKSITVYRDQAPRIYPSDYFNLYHRLSGGPSVLYHPAGSNYSSWMSSLINFNFTEDTIPTRKNNELWYRTIDGEPLSLNEGASMGVVNNEYKAGYGIVQFNTTLVEIKKNAFNNDTTLTSITIPSTVETIGDSAFANCSNLKKMTVEWDTPIVISDNVFDSSMCKVLYVPQNTRRLYQNALGWNKFKKIIQPYNYVEGVKFEKENYSLREGDTIKVNAIVYPDDAVIQYLDWYSSDDNIATVQNGVVIGKEVGSVYVIVVTKDGTNLKDSCLIQVTPVLAETVQLNHQSVNILVEHSILLKAKVLPEMTTYKDVIWKSSDESVLKVEAGLITGLKAGVASVTATTTDGTAITASCEVIVNDYFPADVNWDAEFNIADVAGTVNFILEKNTEDLVFDAADMNNDGVVLVNDLKDVLDVIMNSDTTTAKMENVHRKPHIQLTNSSVNVLPELILSEYHMTSSSTMILTVGIVDANLFSGIQFDMELPEGMSLSQISAGMDLERHLFITKRMANGLIRVAIYSMNNDYFSSNSPDLLSIDVNFENTEQDNFEIHFRNTIVTTIMAKPTFVKDKVFMLVDQQITGVNDSSVIIDNAPTASTSNLKGVIVNDDYKGIVIKKGRKYYNK